MIETLTTAVIVLAVCLVGLALLYSVLLSDQNKRIQRIRDDIDTLEQAQRDNYFRNKDTESRLDNVVDLTADEFEKISKALTKTERVARWRSFNKFDIMHEDESPRCAYCLSDDTEFDTKYVYIAGSAAPDRVISQCCKCGQKSSIWRYEDGAKH